MSETMNLQIVTLPAGVILFPGGVISIKASRKVRDAINENSLVGCVIPQHSKSELASEVVDVKGSYNIGTVSKVLKVSDDGLVLKGIIRFQFDSTKPMSMGASIVKSWKITLCASNNSLGTSDIIKIQLLQSFFTKAVERGLITIGEEAPKSPVSMSWLLDYLLHYIPLKFDDKILLFCELVLARRIQMSLLFVMASFENSVVNASNSSNTSKGPFSTALVPKKTTSLSRPTPPASPSEKDSTDEELRALEEKLGALVLPEDSKRVVDRELKRLTRMHPSSAEYQVCRTFLETVSEVPWNTLTKQDFTVNSLYNAREILDHDHFGQEKVKKRLLEYLAVLQLKEKQQQKLASSTSNSVSSTASSVKAPILLLVGPPGVGKTSLAKSVANALGRKFHRVSLGGVRDEAEIRGHRRTYVGAMPGLFVQALRKVGTMNPLILLDEVDKVTRGSFQGDPAAALLEVLDPEQNNTFTDHYISFPVDLSQVLFIATANSLDTIPAPLLDRMEVIELSGYTYLEKEQIARQYLLPKQREQNGLQSDELILTPEALQKIATSYTREAGVRSLERNIGSICRARAVELLENEANTANTSVHADKIVDADEVKKYLGLEKFHSELIDEKNDIYGVVNGLAYTGSGNGSIMILEATTMPGEGKLKCTGRLGDVISESAHIALSWVKANASKLSLGGKDFFKGIDIHLHAPAGAIPKDGPSAGVAMTITFASLLSKRPVPRDLALTGEMTLRGKVLAVGGIREKLLGAHQAGITRVILPDECMAVVKEECQFVNDIGLEIYYVKTIWEVISILWSDMQLNSHL